MISVTDQRCPFGDDRLVRPFAWRQGAIGLDRGCRDWHGSCTRAADLRP
jgi:hypothetical protein